MPEQELELNEASEGGKKSKKLVIFGGIGLVLALLIGGGVWFFMGSDEPENTDSQTETETSTDAKPMSMEEANYVGMPRPFLFNLPGVDRARLVEIKVQLMVRGDDSVLTQKHIPLIEDALLTTFSAADVQKLSTQAGKDELRQLALLNVQNTLQPITGKKVVEKVLFTGFVMQ
ncbi:flagellar basal body-associated protein FliL [Shewanella sp. 11B5]|uniref:flagellar basal body-associated protein FliL n=1 Tax=Shewanella TaxID=22 RepID=UPI000C7D5FAB|nr:MULTISPECIES: flagellar basal body-associated protein FliL [unclassified Shewanella]MBB1427741.1 flagellar basal body-associated protein FliL [Shewanella sp. SG44-2]PKI08131.1 flagellar basal body-associated protein FliL [Shewanella sp. 11B5]